MGEDTASAGGVAPPASQPVAPPQYTPAMQSRLTEAWNHDLDKGAVAGALATLGVRVEGQVPEYRWDVPAEREAACEMLRQHAVHNVPLPGPILLKGPAKHWPAVEKWSLDWMARQWPKLWVWVRCAPSLLFYYTEPKMMKWYNRVFSTAKAPTMLAKLRLEEFAMRMQRDCPLPPIFYKASRTPHKLHRHAGAPPGEYCYMQSPLMTFMADDLDLESPPFTLVMGKRPESGQVPDAQQQPMLVAQHPRLWLSGQGAISPLHYDSATSFLTQIRGRKRMVWWPQEALNSLYLYPNWHILRRRSRCDPVHPDFHKHPKFEGLSGVEAIIEPGDTVVFPGYWAHWTESMDLSLSMTYRFAHRTEKAKMHSRHPWLCGWW